MSLLQILRSGAVLEMLLEGVTSLDGGDWCFHYVWIVVVVVVGRGRAVAAAVRH